MQIFGHPWSINTRKALAAALEKGVRVELVLVDLPRGKHLEPEHVARHPFAKAPVLTDGDFTLYESAAILRYLDRAREAAPLVPADARGAARVDQWTSVAQTYFGEPAHALAVEAIFKRLRGFGEPDPAAIAKHVTALERPLAVLDRQLAGSEYLAGAFSLAELHCLPYLEYASRLAVGRAALAQHAHVTRWWTQLAERPAWREVARTGAQPPIGADVA
jgi:glutathione S-transferase